MLYLYIEDVHLSSTCMYRNGFLKRYVFSYLLTKRAKVVLNVLNQNPCRKNLSYRLGGRTTIVPNSMVYVIEPKKKTFKEAHEYVPPSIACRFVDR